MSEVAIGSARSRMLSMALGFVVPLVIGAQSSVEPLGSGTLLAPYVIDSLPNLHWLSQTRAAWGGVFVQSGDIDAYATATWNNDSGFSPIGDAATKFTGRYNGKGHVIDGLYIRRPNTDGVGLFGRVGRDGALDSLGLEGGAAEGGGHVGALVGILDTGTVRYCHSSNRVSSVSQRFSSTGGLIATSTNGLVIECFATGEVRASTKSPGSDYASGFTGGLVAENRDGTIRSSFATGNVTVADSSSPASSYSSLVGGLVGTNRGDIVDCHAIGMVSASVTGASSFLDVGGLVGTNNGRISSSRASGAIKVPSSNRALVLAGGLAGTTDYGSTMGCHATGVVKAYSYSSPSIAGGLIGGNSESRVSGCFSTGTVSAVSGISTAIAGGLLGQNSYATIDECHSTGAVIASSDSSSSTAGGLVGDQRNTRDTIIRCYATGSVSAASGKSQAVAGGLLGINNEAGKTIASYAAGSVEVASPSYATAGGFVGINGAVIDNCYATGAVTTNGRSYCSAGGFAARSTSPGVFNRCYSTGFVKLTGATAAYAGGFMGYGDGNIFNSYWNTESAGQQATCAPGISCPSAGLSTAQMRRSENFKTWDFDTTWILYRDRGYPLLRSFLQPLVVTAKDSNRVYDGRSFSGGNGVAYSAAIVDSLLKGTPYYGGSSQGAVDTGNYPITVDSLWSTQQGYRIEYAKGTLRIVSQPSSAVLARPAMTWISDEPGAEIIRSLAPVAQGNGKSDLGGSVSCEGGACQTVEVRLPGTARVHVSIFDNLATPVASWGMSVGKADLARLEPSGDGRRVLRLAWNARTPSGSAVAAGVYLWKILVQTDNGQKLETVKKLGLK